MRTNSHLVQAAQVIKAMPVVQDGGVDTRPWWIGWIEGWPLCHVALESIFLCVSNIHGYKKRSKHKSLQTKTKKSVTLFHQKAMQGQQRKLVLSKGK